MHIEQAMLGEDGRLVIPATTLQTELGLRPGDTVIIESDGDSLLLRGFQRVLQESFAPHSITGSIECVP